MATNIYNALMSNPSIDILNDCFELELGEELLSISFWSAYLCTTLLSQPKAAVHLISRIPLNKMDINNSDESEELKGLIDVANIINKVILKDTIAAIDLIKFRGNFQILGERLKNRLRNEYWNTLTKAYTSIRLDHMCIELVMSQDDIRTECMKLGWNIDNSTGLVYPKPTISLNSDMNLGFNNGAEAIKKLSSHVALFERKYPKVDMVTQSTDIVNNIGNNISASVSASASASSSSASKTSTRNKK